MIKCCFMFLYVCILCSVVNPHAENYNFATDTFTYPTWWLESVGYWGAPGTPAKVPLLPYPSSSFVIIIIIYLN